MRTVCEEYVKNFYSAGKPESGVQLKNVAQTFGDLQERRHFRLRRFVQLVANKCRGTNKSGESCISRLARDQLPGSRPGLSAKSIPPKGCENN